MSITSKHAYVTIGILSIPAMSKFLIIYIGYATHESACWSEYLQKWIFMPRKISQIGFEDKHDEISGSNTVLVADESFDNIDVSQ